MLPAAFTTVAMEMGVNENALLWSQVLGGLMLLPVLLRCLFLPQILCALNGLYLLYEGVNLYQTRRAGKGLMVGVVTLIILLISLPGLERFFQAMMGI